MCQKKIDQFIEKCYFLQELIPNLGASLQYCVIYDACLVAVSITLCFK